MAVAVGRGFLVRPCSSSSFLRNDLTKSSLGITTTFSPSKPATRRRYSLTVVRAQQRPTWLPGLDPPPYLDGT